MKEKKKETKTMTDKHGVTWTIEHTLNDSHIGYSDTPNAGVSMPHFTMFGTRSGALRWMKRMVKEANNR
jgi:hypothetical protein